MVKFKIKHTAEVVIVEFELERNLKPSDLRDINPPDLVKENFSSKIMEK